MNTTVTLCSTGARGVMVSTEFFYTRGPGFKATADLFFYTLRFKANTFCSPYVSSLSGRKAPVVRKAERFFRRRLGFCPGVNRPQSGGIQFGRRPNVLLAVGELFVRARSARSQARSACVIARRRRVSAEGFARLRRALCSGAKCP